MSVTSTSETESISSKMSELDRKAAAASAALVEKMRAVAEAKAIKAAEKEAAKAAEQAKKAAEKAEKDAAKAAEKAEKDAAKAAEKARLAEERAAAKAAKAAEEAAKPKRPVGRPRKDASASSGSSVSSTSESIPTLVPPPSFADLREPLPAVTPAMRARITAVELPDIESFPATESETSVEVETIESLRAEISRLRDHIAKLTALTSRQKYAIHTAFDALSAGC
jgi:hypothetical protein